jgi:hypothetical protein
MEDIKIKIKELFKEAGAGVNYIAYGRKTTNGTPTGELAIIYGVEEKKPLSELSIEEIIPNIITIESTDVKTDVFVMTKAELIACTCGSGWSNGVGNRVMARPLKGGLSVTSTNLVTTVGTLGFIAKHTESEAIVGVTNNHVLIQDAFYTSERNLGPPIKNEYTPIDSVYQHGESGTIPPSNFIIGQTLRYVPITASSANNKVDCSIFSINQSDVDATSVEQIGEAYTDPLPFATTADLDNLLTTNPVLYSSGRTSGPKGGVDDCDLRVFALFGSFLINYLKQGVSTTVVFENQITYVKVQGTFGASSYPNPPYTLCADPVMGGDSGSALIADYSGVRKIIGLVFAGGGQQVINGPYFQGFANRIDDVASEIGIEAWDGDITTTEYVDTNSIDYITTSNGSPNKTEVCGIGNDYWQVGLTTLDNSCIP